MRALSSETVAMAVVAMPFGNRAQLSFPAIGEAMGKLQAMINSAMPSSTSIPTVTAPRTVNASSCQISSAIASGEFVQRPVQFNTVILSGVHGTDPGAPS